MQEEILKFLSILLLTMLKFISGPTLGYAAGFNYITTVLVTVSGMMSSVFLFTFLGSMLREKIIKKYFKRDKIFTSRSRKFVKIWQKYGAIGVAILTPLLFSPIVGTVMLTSTGTKKRKIVIYMFFSATFWAFIFAGVIFYFGDAFLKDYLESLLS